MHCTMVYSIETLTAGDAVQWASWMAMGKQRVSKPDGCRGGSCSAGVVVTFIAWESVMDSQEGVNGAPSPWTMLLIMISFQKDFKATSTVKGYKL